MSPPPISLIEELSPNDIEKLTQLLVLSPMTVPHPVWLQEQADFIATLPPKLKRPESLLPRLAMALPFGKQKAHLCPSHKPLNPYLIRRIFLQVSAECTTRLTRLVSNPYLPPNIAIHVKALQTANSLWMSPDLYRVTFQCQPEEERFDRIASDCEACILAAVGGNIRILQELRTSMLGRKKKRGKEARLLPLVEEWIDWTGAKSVVREQSDKLAKEIRASRRQMQEARRQKRRNEAEGIVDSRPPPMTTTTVAATDDISAPLLNHDATAHAFENPFENQGYAYDDGNGQYYDYDREDNDEHEHDYEPEGSIIDFYANRLSSAKQTQAQNESNIHPAFRASMVFQFQTNSSTSTLPPQDPDQNQNDDQDHDHDPLPPRPGSPTAYTATESSLQGGHHEASVRVHQPPPLAYNNRANMKQMQKQWKRKTGYSESVYSRSVNEVAPSAFCPTMPSVQQDFRPPMPNPRQNLRRVESFEVQNRHREDPALRSRDVGEYVPPRQDWNGKGRKEEGDGDEKERRETKVTSFGDFI